MKIRKVPMRSCVVTKEKLEKKDLIRIVRSQDGKAEIDLSGKKNGRGAYLKKDLEVIEKAQKTKVLDKILEIDIDDEIYEELKNLVK